MHSYFYICKKVARSHHENVDGGEYPDETLGEDQSVYIKIIHVVD